jgi:hypothetical protein
VSKRLDVDTGVWIDSINLDVPAFWQLNFGGRKGRFQRTPNADSISASTSRCSAL